MEGWAWGAQAEVMSCSAPPQRLGHGHTVREVITLLILSLSLCSEAPSLTALFLPGVQNWEQKTELIIIILVVSAHIYLAVDSLQSPFRVFYD